VYLYKGVKLLVLVAIVGGSGAGKTSVARKIAEHFADRANVLSMDDYYRDLPPGMTLKEFNFDDPKAFDFDYFRASLKTSCNIRPNMI